MDLEVSIGPKSGIFILNVFKSAVERSNSRDVGDEKVIIDLVWSIFLRYTLAIMLDDV